MGLEVSTVNAIIAGVLGLLAGILGSLIAPWANWQIEKKKMRRNARRSTLAQLRTKIRVQVNTRRVLQENEYRSLRSHMHTDVINELEEGDPPYALQREDERLLLDELDRLERKWKLI